MKIAVLIKIVPDVDNFKYDYEKNILIRDNVKMIVNPDDQSAIEYALSLKDKNSDVEVEVITMAPKSVIPMLKDLLRRNVDKAVLLSDKEYQGSDTYATSIILSTYLKNENYDLILGGTNTLDGDTGHVLNQIGEYLNMWSFSNVLKFNIDEEKVAFSASIDDDILECEYIKDKDETIILGITRDSKKKLRYVKYNDLKLEVSDRIQIIDNEVLNVNKEIIGLHGSPTKVKKSFTKTYEKTKQEIVQIDDDGIQKVYDLLKSKGVLKHV